MRHPKSKVWLAVASALIVSGFFLIGTTAFGVTAQREPIDQAAQMSAFVTTTIAGHAESEVQIRRLRSLLISRTDEQERVYEKLQNLQNKYRSSIHGAK